MPPRDKFLKWVDDFYFEKTPEYISLRAYLRNRAEFSKEQADEIAEEVQTSLKYFMGDVEKAISDAERMGLEFKNQQDFNRFYDLCLESSRNTRMAIHCGHTEKEIFG